MKIDHWAGLNEHCGRSLVEEVRVGVGGLKEHGRVGGVRGLGVPGEGAGQLLILQNGWAVPGLQGEVEHDLFPVNQIVIV